MSDMNYEISNGDFFTSPANSGKYIFNNLIILLNYIMYFCNSSYKFLTILYLPKIFLILPYFTKPSKIPYTPLMCEIINIEYDNA